MVRSEKVAKLEQALQESCAETGGRIPIEPHESRKHIKAVLNKLQEESLDAEAVAKVSKLDPKSVASLLPSADTAVVMPNLDAISHCFGDGVKSVEEVVARLEATVAQGESESAAAQWAQKTLSLLKKMSPMSLKITFHQLRVGAELDLKGCLRMVCKETSGRAITLLC